MSFSCIKINGNSYHVKDSTARTDIASLKTRVQTLEDNAGSGSSGGSSGYTATELAGAFKGLNQTQTLTQSWRNFDALMFYCFQENDNNADCVAFEVPRSVLEGVLLAEESYGDSCDLWLYDQTINDMRFYLKVGNLTDTSWKVLGYNNFGTYGGIYGIKY